MFKCEGADDAGNAFGPVAVIDTEEAAKDPLAQGMGVPYGYEPAWRTDHGWQPKSYARALAESLGVELEVT